MQQTNQPTDWRDIGAACIVGLALAALALHYFDVLFFYGANHADSFH